MFYLGQVYRNLSDDDVKTILDFSEKYVMMCCYKLLFCPHSTNDEDKDLEIQNRIRFVLDLFFTPRFLYNSLISVFRLHRWRC